MNQYLYVSSFVNEYGHGLLNFLGTERLQAYPDVLMTMTLFANGNMMQVLEGNSDATAAAFDRIRVNANQFNVKLLSVAPIPGPTLVCSSLGLQRGCFMQLGKEPAQLQLFRLGRDSVEQRMKPCEARTALMDFAHEHA